MVGFRSEQPAPLQFQMKLLAIFLLATSATVFAYGGLGTASAAGGYTHDCVGESALVRGNKAAVRYLVFCSVQEGKVAFSIRRGRDGRILGFDRRPEAVGGGATVAPRCWRRDPAVACRARKTGPVTFRGTIRMRRGTRCEVPVLVGASVALSTRLPGGCPGAKREQPPGFSHIKNSRATLGLDADLEGNAKAIRRRIRGLRAAWRKGNPVARSSVVQYGVLMRAVDARYFEKREQVVEQTHKVLPRWAARHAPDTFAGFYFDDSRKLAVYVGFTAHQDEHVAALKRLPGLIAPGWIKAFPVPPQYTEAELGATQEAVSTALEQNPELRGFVNQGQVSSIGIDIAANRVQVTTTQVARLRQALERLFGLDAPIEVVYGKPIRLAVAAQGRAPLRRAAGYRAAGAPARR